MSQGIVRKVIFAVRAPQQWLYILRCGHFIGITSSKSQQHLQMRCYNCFNRNINHA